MIRALGDHALVVTDAALALHGPHGAVRSWAAWPRRNGTFDWGFTPRDDAPYVRRFATCADPPRLALELVRRARGRMSTDDPSTSRTVAVIDVATGELSAEIVYGPTRVGTSALAWAAGGDALWLGDDLGALRAVDGRGATVATCAVAGWQNVLDVVALLPGERALVRSSRDERGHRLELVDLRAQRSLWTKPFGFAEPVIVSNDGARFAFAARHVCRIDDGTAVSRWHTPPDAQLVAVWADDAFARFAALDDRNLLTVAAIGGHRPPPRWGPVGGDVDVDLACGRVIGRPSVDEVALWTLSGRRLATFAVHPLADNVACLTRGRAAVIANGALTVASTADDAHTVEGPGDLVAVGPHPRGVIVVDVGGRAHVVDV